MVVVVDTNVIVAALLGEATARQGSSGALLHLLAGGFDVIALWNEAILSEYREVLSRPQFALSASRVRETLDVFTKIGVHVEGVDPLPPELAAQMPDRDDMPFL